MGNINKNTDHIHVQIDIHNGKLVYMKLLKSYKSTKCKI